MQKQNETKKGNVTMKGKYLTPNERLWDEIPKEFLTEQNTWRLLNRQEKALLTEGQLYSYERYWMSVTDERILREAATKKGYNEGWQRGIEKGIEKGHIEDARRMKADNMATELIAKYTGLTIEEVEALT
jgi:predicted transposase/invertase (TIGR01784 family)